MKKLMVSGAGLLVIVLAFFGFNLVSGLSLSGLRLDLTEQKLYTLSPGTQRILSELDAPLDLYFFYSDTLSRDLPPLRNYARRVEEMLKAYRQQAVTNLRVQVIDPQPFSEQEDEAARFGLQAVPLQQGGDNLYFGLAGRNAQGDTQVIPFFALDQEEHLEYELSRLVQTLAKPKRPVVGVLSGLQLSGGFDLMMRQPMPPYTVYEQVRQLFELQVLKRDVDQIPENISVLWLVHPKHLPQQALYAIDQFVLRGGKLLAFIDPYAEADSGELPGELGADRVSDLGPLLEAWGVRLLANQVVGDGAYAMAVGRGQDQRPVRHPGWLNLPKNAIDSQDIALAGLENITLATAGALQSLEHATTRFTPLLSSSEYAMPLEAARFATLNDPEDLMRELEPTGERYVLAARIDGPAQSAFPEGIEGQKDGLREADTINVILVADTDLLSDRMWVQVQDFFGQSVVQPWADNGAFVVNTLDHLSGSEALISVRSRGRFSRPFTVVERLQRTAEQRFLDKEHTLQARLADTEQQLAALQQSEEPGKTLELSDEQQQALQRFIEQKLELRRELREVRYQLNADIDELGRTLKLINIAAVPALLTIVVMLAGLWRRRAQK